jgi:hypothetical protein
MFLCVRCAARVWSATPLLVRPGGVELCTMPGLAHPYLRTLYQSDLGGEPLGIRPSSTREDNIKMDRGDIVTED